MSDLPYLMAYARQLSRIFEAQGALPEPGTIAPSLQYKESPAIAVALFNYFQPAATAPQPGMQLRIDAIMEIALDHPPAAAPAYAGRRHDRA